MSAEQELEKVKAEFIQMRKLHATSSSGLLTAVENLREVWTSTGHDLISLNAFLRSVEEEAASWVAT